MPWLPGHRDFGGIRDSMQHIEQRVTLLGKLGSDGSFLIKFSHAKKEKYNSKPGMFPCNSLERKQGQGRRGRRRRTCGIYWEVLS